MPFCERNAIIVKFSSNTTSGSIAWRKREDCLKTLTAESLLVVRDLWLVRGHDVLIGMPRSFSRLPILLRCLLNLYSVTLALLQLSVFNQ